MKQLITAAAISVALFTAGCSSDSTPATQAEPTVEIPSPETPFDGGILGSAGGFSVVGDWTSDNGSVNIVDDNGNSVNSVTIPDDSATPNEPWNRNFQHVVALTQGESYIVRFKAKSDRDRTVFAGIGQNFDPWTNVKQSVDLTSEWQDFEIILNATGFGSTTEGDVESRIFFELAGDDGLVMIDDVYLAVNDGPATAPTTSAATPPERAAADVISIYGEAYTATEGLNYNPDWGQSGLNDLNVSYNLGDGDLSLAYVNFNYQGTELGAVDASAMEFLHVDIWVPEGTDRLVKVSPINSGTGEGEVLVSVPVMAGAWNSVDLPKSAFTGMTWDSVSQMKFDGQFNGDGSANTTPFDVYLDNIYFYKAPSGGPDTAPTTSAATPPERAAGDVISIYGEAYTATEGLNHNPDWGQSGLNDLNVSYNPGDGDLSLAYVNFNYQGTELGVVDASAMEFLHVDIWVPEGTDRLVKVSPVNSGTGEGEVLVSVPVMAGAWNSVDLPKSAFTGMTWDSVSQMKFDGQFNGDGSANTTPFDVYLDNIYFHKAGGDTTTPEDTNLVSEGGFDTVGTWTSDNGSVNIIDDNGNSVNSVSVPASDVNPGAPWNRNMQQVIPITQGESYTITFRAKSDRARSILVGIGLAEEPWTNTKQSAGLTTEWQDYEITLTAADFGGDQNRVFFEFAGEEGLVLIDDISVVATAVTPPVVVPTGSVILPVTFEDAELAYTWTDFDGGAATVIDNPQTTGNTSTKVAQLVKNAGQPWAGSYLTLDTPIDFAQGEEFTMNFWSASLKPVLLKLEGSLGNAQFTASHSGSGTWESLAFDFTDLTSVLGDVTKMTVIVEDGAMGDGSAAWTFYADDIAQSSGGSTPVTGGDLMNGGFEDGLASWTQTPDAGSSATPGTISLVTSAPGGRSGSVARLEAAGDATAGSQDVLLAQVVGTGTVNPGDTVSASFDLYGSLAGSGGVVFVEIIYLDSNGDDNGRNFLDAAAPYFPNTTWTTHNGSKSAGLRADGTMASVDGGVMLVLKASCGPIDGCGVDAYVDNVTLTITP